MIGMFAVTLPTYGGPEVLTWAEVPDPEPGPGEVLIDVVAAGVNRADLLQRAGFYNPPPGASPYPGMECSGRISAVGEGVTRWHVGDEVCALLTGGGYAEKVAVPAGQVLAVPDGIDLVDAAAFPEVACTVWSNLTRIAHMSHWQTLLVHGGGSGIGTFAIQYASALGVRVLTTARRAKHEVLKALGADVTIDYTDQDFVAETKAATGGRGAELILDIQGASYLNRNIEALADGGCVVIIGLQGGRTGEIDLGAMMAKRATVASTTLRSRTTADKASIVAGVRAEVWPLIEAKKILPVIDRTVPMSQAATAHEIMASSEHIGKVLLVTEPRPAVMTDPFAEAALPVPETARVAGTASAGETALATEAPATETAPAETTPAASEAAPAETTPSATEAAPNPVGPPTNETEQATETEPGSEGLPPTSRTVAASGTPGPSGTGRPSDSGDPAGAESTPAVARGSAPVAPASDARTPPAQYPAHHPPQQAPGTPAPRRQPPSSSADFPA
jgi:putative PIG3 family NAD(P)H quinone oxidoreductase